MDWWRNIFFPNYFFCSCLRNRLQKTMLALSTSVFPSPESMEADLSSSSMSPADHRFCANTLKKLASNQHSVYFRNPVDPIALNCPDYPLIIKHPMDLSTVKMKLDNNDYDSVDAFCSDIRLIFDNCHKYNNPQDLVALEGRKLEEVFDRLLVKRPSAVSFFILFFNENNYCHLLNSLL